MDDSQEKQMTVKGRDGKTITIPESLIGELRFKQTDFKDKWSNVNNSVPKNDYAITKGLRTAKNRDQEFEEILRRDRIADIIKSAPLKVDKEKIQKILRSLVNEITDKEKSSLKKEYD